MSTHTVKKIDDMEAVFGGGFKRARAELGVESFGMQIIDMPPNYDNYPVHDHEQDGQEEVYVTLRGDGEIEIEGEHLPARPRPCRRQGRPRHHAQGMAGRRRHPHPRPRRQGRRGL